MSLLPGVEAESCAAVERRRSHRYPGPFRAVVRGVTAEGGEFKAAAKVKDICAGGMYLRLDGRLEVGMQLTADIFVTANQQVGHCRSGEVIRVEPLIDGRHGAAVRFAGGESAPRHN